VVGAGHAGCEAATSAANLGSKTLLITMDMNKIAQLSCNPAIGGVAKGQIVREIDALGGYSGIVADKTSIQFRLLNRSKGPAMWSPRSQNDREKFIWEWKHIVENTKNLDMWQDTVTQLVFDDGVVTGVKTQMNVHFSAKSVILTNCTFLNGLMHIGDVKIEGGRISEPSSYNLTEQLKSIGFETDRMKTGTPARLDGRTIDFSVLQEQEGEDDFHHFSYTEVENNLAKRSCYIAHTNSTVHDVLRTGFDDSPMYNGPIQSIGPRYCPSIETKIVTFAEKNVHQLFVEPEGENSQEYYLNGFSSSLPLQVQMEALKQIKGFENVKIYRPGYAIEYDFFAPTQLLHTLETKLIKNLFFAGQINGTTGYEEAGAQGLMAGINAHANVHDATHLELKRDQAYIGVLIDDLVTKGVDEPYRMFTSRAEYRILLRQDNADERLTSLSNELGLASNDRVKVLNEKMEQRDEIISLLNNTSVKPADINPFLENQGTSVVKQGLKLHKILSRPQVSLDALYTLFRDVFPAHFSQEVRESAEIFVKYKGYIEREKLVAEKLIRLEHIRIKGKIDYNSSLSLSTEARQKLTDIDPETIAQASRIPGVSPSDISVLLVLMGR
nr:tRNA uridine-5-carboxymethylaminomethyl(34) synthesis enzyme MnmG [Bacteroidales bacterium]